MEVLTVALAAIIMVTLWIIMGLGFAWVFGQAAKKGWIGASPLDQPRQPRDDEPDDPHGDSFQRLIGR